MSYEVRIKFFTMKDFLVKLVVITVFVNDYSKASYCGCKFMRPCYKRMLEALLKEDEDACIENVDIGSATVTIFLKAIMTFCGRTLNIVENALTYEGRNLYEVIINSTLPNENEELPIIVLDAGQDAGIEPVAFALYVIEQLVACFENKEMIQKLRWIILPSTNPDGLEYSRNKIEYWAKNLNYLNGISHGVDITRNFEDSWNLADCTNNHNIFSQKYPGKESNTEIETKFISNVLRKHKDKIKTYVSLRRDGHGIFYPYAARNITFDLVNKVKKWAGNVAAKVNQRAGGIQWFVNDTIYKMNGKAHCGHSVDFAINNLKIPFSFEMRLFSETDNDIMSKFQTLPKGYETSMRMGYFSGIKELYTSIINEMKQPKKTNK